jgi:two-component system chemotaxis sensor kinase CheA
MDMQNNPMLKEYTEECMELLSSMEDSLIALQDGSTSKEDIDAVFRTAHTIKGNSGMFNFDLVISFTHVAENLLTEIRDGHIELSEDMISLLLESKDHLTNLIEFSISADDGDELSEENKNIHEDLLEKLKAFISNPIAESSEQKKESNQNEDDTKKENSEAWHISIEFDKSFFTSGMDIISILKYFHDIGDVISTISITSNVPLLDTINPEDTFIGLEIDIKTSATKLEIVDVFEFVEDDVTLFIFKHSEVKEFKAFLEKSKNAKLIEDTLIERKVLTKHDFDKVLGREVQIQQSKEKKGKDDNKKVMDKSYSLRVDSSKVDALINQISEMVIANASISQRADLLQDNDLIESSIRLTEMLEEIRESVMKIRMVQVGDTFNRFKRIVHDTSKALNKDISLIISGEDTELDKTVIEKISDPLVHIIRNSIDHGIEPIEDRAANGKNKKGTIHLSAYHDAGTIVIEVKDDGKGLDADAILNKAIKNGIVSEAEAEDMTQNEIYNLIFKAGLSTAKEVTNISGRGVGMDVVRRNIEELRGTIEIDSQKGVGSTFAIRLPLTLAIIDGFLVQVGSTNYIVPLEMIQECIELNEEHKKAMNGNNYINLRNTVLPLLDVRTFFKEDDSKIERENIVVVQYAGKRIGLIVDELFGEFQTVIKPMGVIFEKLKGLSGATILGSGEIALIFDIPTLVNYVIKLSTSEGILQ